MSTRRTLARVPSNTRPFTLRIIGQRVAAVVWLLATLCIGRASNEGNLLPVGLRSEYQIDPLAVDAVQPRLSWRVESKAQAEVQSAYQIVAASSRELLNRDRGDWWDSGKVETSQTLGVVYQGAPLGSSQAVFWKVRVWDKAGQASPWSKAAKWEMGLLSPDDWKAQWLNDGKANPHTDADFYQEDPAPLFRKEFAVTNKVVRARLHMAGLGYYEARLNGQRIGDQVLDPGWTRYSERTPYSTHDVTEQIRRGDNCLGVTPGNGWYNPLPLRMWGRRNLREDVPIGRPRFIAQLEVEFKDGTRQTVVSDPTWKVAAGPIRLNSIYLGEIYDARFEQAGWDLAGFDDHTWRQPGLASEPVGPLRAQAQPPIRITREIKAVSVTEPKPGVFLCDLGQNFAGWARLQLCAPAGTKVVLRYGELLNPDGTLNPLTSVAGQIKKTRKNQQGKEESIGGPGAPAVAWQSDTYIAKGKGREQFVPHFTFHGFRYVEVTGLPERPSRNDLTGLRLNTDVERAGSFASSNERFNRIQEMCDWTFLSNMLSVQSDCPHRERFAYGGDIAATSEAFMMNYDMATFYAKTARDWQDSAQPDGMLTDTAPFVGIQYCGIAWAMAHPLLLKQLHQYYGDSVLVAEQYETAKRWLDLEVERNPQLIVERGLSDHESLAPTPAPVLVTPLFAHSAQVVSELATILGRLEDAQTYQRLADKIGEVYRAKFFDPTSGKVGPGTQASQVFALQLGMVPEPQQPAVLQFLLEDLLQRNDSHLSTGIFGTKFLLDTLSRNDRSDLAARVVNQNTFPSWGYMLDNGATTLWENWRGGTNTHSHNHPMFGSVSGWFYHWLGGIQPAPDAVGFDRIVIRPQIIEGLDWVECSYNSVRGRIVSNWKRTQDTVTLEIEIPANTTAQVFLTAEAYENKADGKRGARAQQMTPATPARGQTILQVKSGRYSYLLANPPRFAPREQPHSSRLPRNR